MISFGTDGSIQRIVTSYSQMLLRVAMTRLHSPSDAEDVVQEVFVRLLTAQPRFRDSEHEKAWLIRATLNRAADLCRRAERRNVPLENATAVSAPDTGPSPILTAVQALPAKYSAPIHLYYYEGYSIKEIASILQLPAATVGTRLSRGREQLRRILKEGSE